MSIRIGLFSYNFLPQEGGQGRNFYGLVRVLRDCPGIDARAFSPHTLPLEYHCSTFESVHRYPLGQLSFALLFELRVRKIVREKKLDLVFLNGGPGGVFFLRQPPVPIVYYANHTYSQQSRLVRGEGWKKLIVPLERRSYSFAWRFVANSTYTCRELAERYKVDPRRIVVIPVGIDSTVFQPLRVDRIPHSIFYLGRLDHRKGIKFLVETIPLVKARVPNVRLLIGGSGKLQAPLQAFVHEHRLEENVEFLGRLHDEEIPIWYNRCEVQVMPSVFEGLGIVALEGMACGMLVVATSGSGADDVISDGVNGFLVDYGDKTALANRIVEVLSCPERFKEVRRNAVRRISDEFSWEKIGMQYKEFFSNEVLPAITESQ